MVHRREVKARSEKATTAWYGARLESLARRLWEKRHLLFKSDENMTPQEQEDLIAILEEDKKMDRMRSFLLGVRHVFRDSRNEEEARKALAELKQIQDRTKGNRNAQEGSFFP